MFKYLPKWLRYIFYYRRQNAIDILVSLRERFFNELNGYAQQEYWARNVVDVSEKYIGPDSQLRAGLKDLQFNYMEIMSADTERDDDKVTKLVIRHDPEALLNECIDHIENNGLYKGKGNNILGTLTNSELFTLLVTVAIALFGGAFSMGVAYESVSHSTPKNDKEQNSVSDKQKVDSLRLKVTAPLATSTSAKKR